ncbi:Bifunctional solanapyrone synthase [Leucoagaricus sp. SymC.cos]|nr:Bifunctional solanapyrone synthase [Leucoagaricus sp. SymC.cos]
MRLTVITLLAFLGCSLAQEARRDKRGAAFKKDAICETIEKGLSPASKVFYPGLNPVQYNKGIAHWAASSSQRAKCVVEPGSTVDVSETLKVLASTRTPFAVKGGGHASNPGFSSTTGVQITMSRFGEVTYNETDKTAVIGAGLIWDDVYAALAPHGATAVGGRVTGVGVAGFILGGGYSWKTNQYGLTIDTVVAFELVKPDGTILHVTQGDQPDLFWGLKGGFNNFGIVTRFTLRTVPQETQVWGGLITVTAPFIDQISAATADFSANVKDPKASIITTYNFLLGQPGISQLLFYDGPTPPPGIFDKFMDVPFFTRDVKTRDLLSLVKSSPANATANQRAIFNTVSVLGYSRDLLDAVYNETKFWGARLSNIFTLDSGTFISYDVEPFLPDILSHNDSSSAFPPTRTTRYCPFNIYYAWLFRENDDTFYDAIKQSAARLYSLAIAEGQTIDEASVYGNYAIFDTPPERIYGDNLPMLQALKKLHDPDNIMGLAGGFKF